MKKILFAAVIFVCVSFAKQAFAACEITTTPNISKNTVLVSVKGCPALAGDTRYRVLFTTTGKTLATMDPNEYTYGRGSVYQLSDSIDKPDFSVTFDATKNSNIFTLLSVYTMKNTADTDVKNATPVVKDFSYVPAVTFKKLIISAKDGAGNVVISGGIEGSIRAMSLEISQTPLPAGSKDFAGTPVIKQIPQEKIDPTTKAFSITGLYASFFPNPGSTYYVRQVATYDKIIDKDPIVVAANEVYGSNIKQQASDLEEKSYGLLSSIPDKDGKPSLTFYDPGSKICTQQKGLCSFSEVLNFVIKIAIGLAVVALVIRIMYQGFIYMTSDIPGVKLQAKGSIMDMALGLLIALGSWVILNTINPTLVNNTLSIDEVTIVKLKDLGTDNPPKPGSAGSGKGGTGYDFSKIVFPAGVQCPGKTGGKGNVRDVALSFLNHATYNQDLRGTPAPGGHLYIDCSSYVNTVLTCAGITPKTEAYTGDMAAAGVAVGTVEVKNGEGYVNGQKLKPGDLVGVRSGGEGHVWIYIGNGEVIDSQVSGYTAGKSVIKTKTLSKSIYPKLEPLNFITRQ